ncbi:MAG: CsgG/HfaB family protein [Longimicrobiales bacterium]|nr:CsgG/HfaB family protein [Longimicrobiales bacterium]
MRSRPVPLVVGVALALSACSTGLGTGSVSPDEIPELQRVVADEPANAAAWARLGVAYGFAEQPYDARQALERAVDLPGTPVAAWAHLGTWREEAGDLEGAADAYRRYLAEGGEEAADAVQARLTVVGQRLLARRARAALAREAAISGETPDPGTVGVMPMTVEGPEQYRSLGTGVAELLTTDLSLTDRLEVLERAQLSALVEEMKLALGGYTDPGAAARVGQLLRAGRLVQGEVAIADTGGATRVTALVVDAADVEAAGEVTESGVLDQLMEIEVRLALEIYRQLGIELTDTEVARLEDKPTRNLQAFLAFSEGLELMDAGAFAAAAGRFDAAASLDPGFSAAREAADRARRAGTTETSQVTDEATGGLAVELGDRDPEAVASGSAPPGGSALEGMVDAAVPAGATALETGSTVPVTSTVSSTVETTETTAGTGVGQLVRIPIILTRPAPLVLWWIP